MPSTEPDAAVPADAGPVASDPAGAGQMTRASAAERGDARSLDDPTEPIREMRCAAPGTGRPGPSRLGTGRLGTGRLGTGRVGPGGLGSSRLLPCRLGGSGLGSEPSGTCSHVFHRCATRPALVGRDRDGGAGALAAHPAAAPGSRSGSGSGLRFRCRSGRRPRRGRGRRLSPRGRRLTGAPSAPSSPSARSSPAVRSSSRRTIRKVSDTATFGMVVVVGAGGGVGWIGRPGRTARDGPGSIMPSSRGPLEHVARRLRLGHRHPQVPPAVQRPVDVGLDRVIPSWSPMP